jgi:nucleotide-binding universal stress UspA family protein
MTLTLTPGSPTRLASLLVHLEADAAPEARVRLAAQLATRFGAALTGLVAQALPPPFVAEGVVIADDGPAERAALQHRLAAREDWFRAVAGPLDDLAFSAVLAPPVEAVAAAARGADLVILGPADPRAALHADPAARLELGELLLRLGRPALLVPPGLASLHGDHAVVAWKDSREARRAVSDALPLLAAARRVSVIEVVDGAGRGAAQDRVAAVAKFLGRHGIVATPRVLDAIDRSEAELLVDHALQDGADLLVAGAYGHSRLGEWIFGGMTRSLVTACPMCCLLSH